MRKVGKSGSCSLFISRPPGYPQWGTVPTLEVSDTFPMNTIGPDDTITDTFLQLLAQIALGYEQFFFKKNLPFC